MFTAKPYYFVVVLSAAIVGLPAGSASAMFAGPAGVPSAPMSYGDYVEASIDSSTDVDSYTFQGNAGDLVVIQIHRTSGIFYPMLQLFAPNDSLVKDTGGAGAHQKIVDCLLPYSGTYTVLASDYVSLSTGSYWLSLQCRQDIQANAVPIAYDTLRDSMSVGPYGSIDGYTFEGDAGDVVVIQLHKTSGTFYPKLELFAPNDSLVKETGGAGSHQQIVDYSLPYSGTHTVFVSDNNGSQTGDYWLTLQCRQQVKANATAIPYDSFTDSVSVSPFGDIDGYVFEGNAGDLVIVQLHKTSGTFYPELELFAPNDSLIKETWGTGSHQKIAEFPLPYSGTYTVFAGDHSGNRIGDYWLTLQCRQEILSHVDTLTGKTRSIVRELEPYGSFKAYRLAVNKDDTTRIEMLHESGSINPLIELYGPSDTLIVTNHGYSLAEIVDDYFVESGVYTVFVSDYEGEGIGTYELSWDGFSEEIVDVELPPRTVPACYRAYQSYPNPFNPFCTIRYDLPQAGRVTLRVFDVSGALARTLVDSWREPGVYRDVWDGKADDGSALPSGVYFYSIRVGDFVSTSKMVLLR